MPRHTVISLALLLLLSACHHARADSDEDIISGDDEVPELTMQIVNGALNIGHLRGPASFTGDQGEVELFQLRDAVQDLMTSSATKAELSEAVMTTTANLEAQIGALTSDLSETTSQFGSQLDTRLAEVNTALSEAEGQLQGQITSLSSDLSELQGVADTLATQSSLDELASELSETKQQLASTTSELSEAKHLLQLTVQTVQSLQTAQEGTADLVAKIENCQDAGKLWDKSASSCANLVASASVHDEAPECSSPTIGTLRLSVNGDVLEMCDGTKYSDVVPLPAGSTAKHAAESCKAIKDEGGARGSGQYWLLVSNTPTLAFCDMSGEGELAGDGSQDNPAKSCLQIKNVKAGATSGVYYINPANPGVKSGSVEVYCDQERDGGGWTMVLHSFFSGSQPPTPQHAQNRAGWINNGIGNVNPYKNTAPEQQNNFYFLPFKYWLPLAGTSPDQGASKLRFVGQAMTTGNFFDMEGFHTDNNYQLLCTNKEQTRSVMCGGHSNCFVDARGFSTVDADFDYHSPNCVGYYSNAGWWYDNCFSYNAHHTGWLSHFSGYNNIARDTRHWTWYMR